MPQFRCADFFEGSVWLPRFWLLLALWALGMPAQAEFSGSISFMTDYVYRGYTKSRGNPVGQGNLEYGHESGLYAGFWIAPVSFDDKGYPDRSQVEISPYVGWAAPLAEHWRFDFSAYRYIYDGKLFGRDSDYNEFYASLHYHDWLTARVAFAYDAYNRKAKTFDYEVVGRYSVLDELQLSVGLGFNQAHELLDYDYFYWNAGLTWYANQFVSVDLRYVDTNLHVHSVSHTDGNESLHLRPLENHFLFSLSVGF